MNLEIVEGLYAGAAGAEYSFEVEELIDYGENVLVVGKEEGRGAASGAAVSARISRC